MFYHVFKPLGTLQSKLKCGLSVDVRSGPSPILTNEEEKVLVEWVVNMTRIGYGRTRDQLTMMVKAILDKDGRPNPFKDNRPGKFWLRAFMKRHPELTVRKSQTLGISRAISCTPKVLDEWF